MGDVIKRCWQVIFTFMPSEIDVDLYRSNPVININTSNTNQGTNHFYLDAWKDSGYH